MHRALVRDEETIRQGAKRLWHKSQLRATSLWLLASAVALGAVAYRFSSSASWLLLRFLPCVVLLLRPSFPRTSTGNQSSAQHTHRLEGIRY